MVKLITILLSGLLFSQITSGQEGSEMFVNPPQRIPDKSMQENRKGYPCLPPPPPNSDKPSVTLFDYFEFCNWINEIFSESNITKAEAESLYVLLETQLRLRDESYGMPPGLIDPDKVIDVRERVMIRKTGYHKYQIFYYRIGCGRTLFLREVIADEIGRLRFRNIEVWSESYPC